MNLPKTCPSIAPSFPGMTTMHRVFLTDTTQPPLDTKPCSQHHHLLYCKLAKLVPMYCSFIPSNLLLTAERTMSGKRNKSDNAR